MTTLEPEPDGGGKISLAIGGSKKRPSHPAPANGVKRRHAALHDAEDQDDEHADGATQLVSRFDHTAGGAIDESAPKEVHGPLVIAAQLNRDWREATKRRRQQSGLPGAGPLHSKNEELLQMKDQAKPTWGLNVPKAEEAAKPTANGATLTDVQTRSGLAPADSNNIRTSTQVRSDDERALDALLGKSTAPSLVLPVPVETETEDAAFRRSYASAPAPASLEDYARVPVDAFGAALLRGMGWKDGEGIGSDAGRQASITKAPERRPALLGIGAKADAAIATELGAWGKAVKGKGGEGIYAPVVRRDKRTGETFTEDEWKKRVERREREMYEREFAEKKERKRRKERRAEEHDDGHVGSDSRREDLGKTERRVDKDRYRDRDRDREHQYRGNSENEGEERRYRKEKERRHREREHESRRNDPDDNNRRHRPRDRSREQHRDRSRR